MCCGSLQQAGDLQTYDVTHARREPCDPQLLQIIANDSSKILAC